MTRAAQASKPHLGAYDLFQYDPYSSIDRVTSGSTNEVRGKSKVVIVSVDYKVAFPLERDDWWWFNLRITTPQVKIESTRNKTELAKNLPELVKQLANISTSRAVTEPGNLATTVEILTAFTSVTNVSVNLSVAQRRWRGDLIEVYEVMKGLDRVDSGKLFPLAE
eukprot:g38675.t1